jgi:hypothetical protein
MARADKKKAAPKKAAAKSGPSRRERMGQLKLAFTMTRKADSKMLPLVLGTLVITAAVFVLLGILIGHLLWGILFALVFSFFTTTIVFGRRVQKTAFTQVEGQIGAAAAVLNNMRGNWRVTPAVGFTKEQDLLHQVIGRPGIILVGEGNPNRVRNLIGTRKRELARLVGETPVYDVVVGDNEGQIPLKGLEKHFMRLPRNIKPAQVNTLDARLKAIRGTSALPIPKGPIPTRMPRGKVR